MYFKSAIHYFTLLLALGWLFWHPLKANAFSASPNCIQYPVEPDTLHAVFDTLALGKDTLGIRTKKTKKTNKIESPVKYASKDSFTISLSDRKILLYKEATVDYQDISLSADYVEFDMAKKTVFATSMKDSAGNDVGKPVFKEGKETFNAGRLTYNFDTKKGFIEAVRTEQEGGFLHAEETKREANGHIDLKNGKYTTCDAEHPHYYIALTKAIDIPGDKIVSGPAYIVLEDVPLPIGIPFGFFPNTKTSVSGILIPKYGEEVRRGFFLQGGGYYFAINQHWDLRVTGDIYSKGTWGVDAATNYKKRYKYSGSFQGKFYKNVYGEKGLPDYSKTNDYSIQWSHRQDAKAHPTRTFAANVNLSTTTFDQNHSYNFNNYLNNRKSSSISYTKTWRYVPLNFAASFNHAQNSQDRSVELGLPRITFNMGTIYPFRSLNKSGKDKWYENVSLSYSSELKNEIKTVDTLLFTSHVFDKMNNGFQQQIPLTWNIKPISGINFAPSLTYKGVLYTSRINKYWDPTYPVISKTDTTYGQVRIDTIPGLNYAQAFAPSLSITVNPKIYGTYLFSGSHIKAIRHVMTPSVGFSYVPDLRHLAGNYYRTLIYNKNDTTVVNEKYSIYEGKMYGTPASSGQSANLSLSLRNTLEMKVKSQNDTAQELKKVKLLETFDFRTNYNIITHTWSNIGFNTGTKLLNNKIDLRLTANIDPYSLDSIGRRTKMLEWTANRRIGRITNAALTLSTDFKSKAGKKTQTGNPQPAQNPENTMEPNQQDPNNLEDYSGQYVDFQVPWSIRIDYSWNYSKPFRTSKITQSAGFSGDVSLTPKWKVGYRTGYDFVDHKITATNINIYRDLHCWEMRLSLIPFGTRKSYTFSINVKSTMLKDLKYNKQKSWYDNF